MPQQAAKSLDSEKFRAGSVSQRCFVSSPELAVCSSTSATAERLAFEFEAERYQLLRDHARTGKISGAASASARASRASRDASVLRLRAAMEVQAAAARKERSRTWWRVTPSASSRARSALAVNVSLSRMKRPLILAKASEHLRIRVTDEDGRARRRVNRGLLPGSRPDVPDERRVDRDGAAFLRRELDQDATCGTRRADAPDSW
jgi:hypothetical protein